MIFNLFKSKNNWQHKDSNVRIAAINEELNIDNNADKAILLSLLNEDSSELVRRAVLLKLNSFDHYLQVSFANDKKNIREFATKQVETILSGTHNITLSNDEKKLFLNETVSTEECKVDTALLMHWLEHENEPSLILALFDKLVKKKNPAQFLLQIFTKKQSFEIQKQLLMLEIEELKETSLLTKLNKKAVDNEISQIITDRLSTLVEEKEKPEKLLKKMQLLLSKLLALKDQPDYAYYLTNKAMLENQWQQNVPELTCLSEEEQQTLLDKFNKITKQLTQIFASKEEAYQQSKIEEQLLKNKEVAKVEFNEVINKLNQKITTAVFEGDIDSTSVESDLLNLKEFSNTLSQLNEKITASVLNKIEQAEFLKKSSQLAQRLTKLPEIAESVSEATYLISNISQLALPQSLSELNDRQKTYDDWLKNYKVVNKKASGYLPQSIITAHKEITNTWKNGLKPLQQEQRKLFEQTKKKLIDLKRLLASGKYKVCFGLFKGVNEAVTLLSSQQVDQLQHDIDIVSAKITEISDWEHYIATPRKQELLLKINALVTTPLDDPNAQADKVKHYRKTWNSLGHAEEDVDKELNEKFNLACEQAFAPCRLFYAEQEKIRALHLVTRKEILVQAQALADTVKDQDGENATIDFKVLDGKLNKLQQRWQQAGEVDREQYQKLFKQFKYITQPIKLLIKSFYDANGTQKQTLIAQAEQQLVAEDNFQAIENIKSLQQQWRNIGFAGSHQESKLWQKFRAINDQVFAKRAQAKSAQQVELVQLTENFNLALNGIKTKINEIPEATIEKSNLLSAKEEAEELLRQVIANKPVIKSVASAIEIFIKQLSSQITKINAEYESKSWQDLFIILEKMAQSDVVTAENIVSLNEYKSLTTFWQKRVSDLCLVTTQADLNERADKTLELEILAQIESPTELASQRMIIQVKLMQEQMQSSGIIDLQQRFVDWLTLGKLDRSDVELLNRLKKIFA